jgi:ferric-dicitrate binding protein FerR (iron transport regulator)
VKFTVTKNSRNIELQGMAHFEVAKNPNAPFVIRSGQNQVTVLGTGFDVRSYNKKPLQVTVNHGKVRVEKLANNSNTLLESAILTQGMRVTENPSPKTKQDNYFTIESNINLNAVSWSKGSLSFNNAPLNDVIASVEERYNVQIEVLGNAPRGIRNNNNPTLTAQFNQNQDAEAVCEIIGQALDLTLQVNR